jgi:hypothetical protein
MRTTQILLNSSETVWHLTGEATRADGWYGYTDGKHTIAVYLNDFRGRIWVEASLATNPTEADWFPIHLGDTAPYLQFPKNPQHPTGHSGDTGVEGFTFTANVIWLRARVDRSYIQPQPNTPDEISQYGVVNKILLNG